MNRLNSANLGQLPSAVQLPRYDRASLKPGIVHLGLGAFHRAHQAYYTDAVLNHFGGDWGIVGCSLRSANVREQLAPQDNPYTLDVRSGEGVQLPRYDRASLKPGIVHLGIGAFHRAHQAYYTEAVLNHFGGDWGIVGCSLRSANVREQLAPQDNLYTLVERSGEGEKLQLIGAVLKTMVGPEDPAALVALMADPAIRIVSLTVTEKGYCHDPATGDLNLQHPDIIHDLAHLDRPVSAIGYLVAALQQRFKSGHKSFTAL